MYLLIVPRWTDNDRITLQKTMQYSRQSIEIALENKDSISRIEAAIQGLIKTVSGGGGDDDDVVVGPTKIYTGSKQTRKWFLVS